MSGLKLIEEKLNDMLEKEYKIMNEAVSSVANSMMLSQKGQKIAEIKKTLDEIVQRPTTILVCGEFKRGKSTFVNALIGRKVCPTDTDICTSTVTCIKYGEKTKATRLYGDFSNLKTQEIDFDDIEKYTVGSAEEIDNTVCIEVELPLQELQKGLTIIDTPGVGGLDPRHAALTNFFLPRADITLFMSDVNEPLTATELNYYKNKVLQYARRSAIIVNKADLKDAEQIEEIRQDTLNKISSYTQVDISKLHVLSVSSADCIREEPNKGNFPTLEKLINQLVTNFKMESLADLRDSFSEQLVFAITPLQVQLNQIASPSMDQIKELSFKKDDIDRQLKDLADPQSSFRLSVNKKISTERESIIMWLNNECIMFANEGFNALLHDNHATSSNGGKWLGEQIKQKIDEMGSEITLQLNKAFERIASYEEFGGYWWLPLPILQNTTFIVVNQPLANSYLVIQNQRGTKTGQNHGKIKSRILRPKYPLWNTSVSFAKVQICPLKNEGKSLFLSFTTHFPTIVPQMWLLQTVLTSNGLVCENWVLNFVLHSDGHFQKRELAIEPKICHPYCPILGFVNV